MEIKHLIAHRGNITGPNPEKENNKGYILDALTNGFECEIDVWFLNNKFFLGHDDPENEIEITFLLENFDKLWIHCKNLEAINELSNYQQLNYFWHEKDKFTLTSKNYIWTYPNQESGKNSVIVSLEKKLPSGEFIGICSDYIKAIKEEIIN
ncbi:hypothetical protein N9U49_00760 [Acidimicrobiaceae bacterium]|jgi:hypothetical protein|nr:hypothetical protein [Acidimicrobiaceae bacterium]|tara:strand:+ start:3565 stop:4020 length:456 start_codon:yes stop_codon:yes gene_type:complete